MKKRKTAEQKVYDPRYMTKRRPVLPRAACTSLWERKQRGSGDGQSNILDWQQAGVARNKLMPVQRMPA